MIFKIYLILHLTLHKQTEGTTKPSYDMSTPAAEQKKLLEQLMGKESHYNRYNDGSRNKYHHTNSRGDLGLYDPKICKAYLVGDCPYDLFQGTKQSIGRCPQIHLAKYKLQYERERKHGHKYPDFEREYVMILSKFINECNGQIKIALKKLEHTPEERAKIQEVTKEIDVIDKRIGLMMQEIDILIKHNQVSRALKRSLVLEQLQERRVSVAKKIKFITENVGQSAQQKLQVCEVCGAYLSRLDTDRRLADHFLGKIHLGYVKMREYYKLYNKKKYPQ